MNVQAIIARKELVKKDIVIAVVAVLIVAAVAFGLATMRPDLPAHAVAPVHAGRRAIPKPPKTSGKVVMRVNGEPVTEASSTPS